MMRERAGHTHGSFAAFLLLGVFALAGVMSVLLTAQLYRRGQDEIAHSARLRVIESYLANALRTGDRDGGIWTDTASGTSVLCIYAPEREWVRCIYCADGMLYDQITDGSVREIELDEGEAVAPLSGFEPSRSDEGIHIDFTDADGCVREMDVPLVCNRGEAQP